jgi:two-component system nitrogen regulation response regulator GlnG
MSHVLIVDDEESICWGLERLLHEAGHRVSIASSAEDGLSLAENGRPDLVVLDVRLPGMDGLTAMSRFAKAAASAPIVVITAFGNLDTAVRALRNGAFDYLAKPFDLEQAATVMERALAHRREAKTASPAPSHAIEVSDELLGTSPAMQEVFKRIALVAPTDAAVLITGESGTGKELVARAIHRHSLRSLQPFVPINLASLSPTLVESELFGHVRGAFTGAEASRQGLLELANGATVFFDEAADIPESVQVKLLRVLEQHEVTPVGDTRPRPSAFRAIAATNRDLRREFQAGGFRQDLYFRLAVFEIALPSLCHRVEDIPILAQRFLQRLSRPEMPAGRLTEAALAELCRRRWIGNVRELRNAVEHGALMARGGAISPEHLPPPLDVESARDANPAASLAQAVRAWAAAQLATGQARTELYQRFLAEVEPPLFDSVLDATGQNRAAAAEVLGIHRATLRKKLN